MMGMGGMDGGGMMGEGASKKPMMPKAPASAKASGGKMTAVPIPKGMMARMKPGEMLQMTVEGMVTHCQKMQDGSGVADVDVKAVKQMSPMMGKGPKDEETDWGGMAEA